MESGLKKWFLLAVSVWMGWQLIWTTNVRAETWIQTGTGPFSWNDPLNWSPSIPNSASAVADFTTFSGPATQSVTLDAPFTIGTLNLTNPDTSYTISNGAGGSFTLDNGGSAAAITMSLGGVIAQTVNANINLTAGLEVTNNNPVSGDTLTIGGSIGGTGPLVKLGTGTLVLSGANTYTGNTYFGPSTGGTGAINSGRITLSGG